MWRRATTSSAARRSGTATCSSTAASAPGAAAEVREALIRRLVADVAAAAGNDPFGVWVYLLELPPAAMVEFGHVLPESGGEAAWTDALPATDRARMEAIRDKPEG